MPDKKEEVEGKYKKKIRNGTTSGGSTCSLGVQLYPKILIF